VFGGIFDTLYGIDTSWRAQPQMVEGHHVDEDGLTWTLTLRDGLRFHDGEPVLARDASVRFRLKRPFPHLPEALAGPGGNCPRLCRSVWRRPRPSSR
jgi:peptide/nickel transport system substrate-binding protein